MFSEDKIYGWGAGNVILFRDTSELHPNHFSRTGAINYYDKRRGAAYRWRSASISRIFVEDYPWRQTLILSIFATLIFTSFYLLNDTLPSNKIEQLAKPVEIVVALTRDEPQQAMLPEKQRPLELPEAEQIEQAVIAEPVTEKPRPKTIVEPKEVKPDVYRKKPVKVFELPVPSVKKKRRYALRDSSKSQKIAKVAPPIEKQPKRETVTISPPAVRQRNYQVKTTMETSQASQTRELTDFVSKKDDKPAEDIMPTGRLEKRYNSERQNQENSNALQLKSPTDIIALNRSEETVGLTSQGTFLADRRYGFEANSLRPPIQTATPSTDRHVSFQHQRNEKITGLKPQKRTRSFTKKSSSPHRASKGTGAAINFSAPRQQIELTGTKLVKGRQSDGSYVLGKSKQFSSRAPQSTQQEFSFHSQKREEKPALVPPVSAKLRAKKIQSAEKGSSSLANTHDFSDTITLDDIDPSELISLSEFTVCKDPEREFRQKTKLAVSLHGPTRIEAQGVMFFIKYPESGYTIEIDIYNPRGRHFKTRCEVMQLAIDNIVNRAN